MKIITLLFVAALAYALVLAQCIGPDHPKITALIAFGVGVWPCAVIKVFKL